MARDEDFEEDEFLAQEEENFDEDPVENDDMNADDDGFIRGCNKADELDESEEEEEEL